MAAALMDQNFYSSVAAMDFEQQQQHDDNEPFDLDAFADRFLSTASPAAAAAAEAPTFSSLLEELLCDADLQQLQMPQRNLGEALALAISKLRGEFLAQVWAPATRDEKLVLTTQGQPFSLTQQQQQQRSSSNGDLIRYRALSTGYVFSTSSRSSSSKSSSGSGKGSECEFFPGLPGRVFTRLTPEWTPNVQFYDSREYLRVRDAAQCNIRGSLALPVIDPCTRSCLAVVELVSNFEKLDYVDEIGILCSALQVVNLSSSPDVGRGFLPPEIPRKGREAVFCEIFEILTAVCQAHKLPLAQTWVPCTEDGGPPLEKQLQLSTRGAPFYVRADDLWGFRQACSEQVLELGQGVAGRAFASNQHLFEDSVCNFSREEYPLVHYARYFNLRAAVGIRLRSVLTGTEDYVLEFFLPRDCIDKHEQQSLLSSLSMLLQRVCKSLRTLSSKELSEKVVVIETRSRSLDLDIVDESGPSDASHSSKRARKQGAGSDDFSSDSFWSESTFEGNKSLEKKRVSSEKTVPLEVLQKYFAGSLKDAAKSIGVCPTTLKRICRQYGISRWPSRKINKVSRSLVKLQGVIDSVEGIDRAVKLDCLNGEMANTVLATANLTRKTQGDDTVSCSSEFQGTRGTSSCHQVETYPPFVKVEPRVHGSSAAFSALGTTPPAGPLLSMPEMKTVVLMRNLSEESFPSRAGSQEDLHSLQQQQQHQQQHSPSMSTVTIKAKLGPDTARFKLPVGFAFAKLRAEVASRFKVEAEAFSLKYLDDDAEWVMLNCDEDLQECLDVMQASSVNIIKLVVQEVFNNLSSPSLSSVNL